VTRYFNQSNPVTSFTCQRPMIMKLQSTLSKKKTYHSATVENPGTLTARFFILWNSATQNRDQPLASL